MKHDETVQVHEEVVVTRKEVSADNTVQVTTFTTKTFKYINSEQYTNVHMFQGVENNKEVVVVRRDLLEDGLVKAITFTTRIYIYNSGEEITHIHILNGLKRMFLVRVLVVKSSTHGMASSVGP